MESGKGIGSQEFGVVSDTSCEKCRGKKFQQIQSQFYRTEDGLSRWIGIIWHGGFAVCGESILGYIVLRFRAPGTERQT